MTLDLRRLSIAAVAFVGLFVFGVSSDASAQTLNGPVDKTAATNDASVVRSPSRRRGHDVVSNGTGQTGGLPAVAPSGSVVAPVSPLLPAAGTPGGPPPPSSDAPSAERTPVPLPRLHIFLAPPLRVDDGWLLVGRAIDGVSGRPLRRELITFPFPGTTLEPQLSDRRGVVVWKVTFAEAQRLGAVQAR